MSVVVRRARLEDAPAIAAVHISTWQVAYRGLIDDEVLDGLDGAKREARWRRTFADGDYDCWVAIGGEQVVGFISVGSYRGEEPWGEVYAVYVHPDSWGEGVGRQLWREATGPLGAEYETLALWVLRSNQRARRFYESAGWRADGAEKIVESHGATLDEIRYVSA